MTKIRIEIRFLGLVRLLTRKPSETVRVDSSDIIGLLSGLFKKYGQEFRKAILDESSNSIKPNIVVSVNGRTAKDLREMLKEGDTVIISTVTVGG